MFYPWHGWEWRAKVPPSPWLNALMLLIGVCVMIPTFVIVAVIFWMVWWVFGAMWVMLGIVIVAEVIEHSL